MAIPGIKYDDGTTVFATNCFPVRGLIQECEEEGAGAWLVEHKAEQRRRFKAVVCAKHRTYSQIKEERKRTMHTENMADEQNKPDLEEDEKILDGFFLLKHCFVEDPTDLCSVNVSGEGLTEVKQDDFCLFDNVAYVNVSENILPFESLKYFPIIRELEMSLNGLRNITVNLGDFPHLEVLDLSYNNLSPEDVLPLGLIPSLRILHLTGNYLKTLPNLSQPYEIPGTMDEMPRFPCLETLSLDDNKFSDVGVFASLAALRQLRHLNLSKNGFFCVPNLVLVDGRHVTQDSETMMMSIRKRRSGRRNASNRKERKTRTSSRDGNRSILKNSPSLDRAITPSKTKSSLTKSERHHEGSVIGNKDGNKDGEDSRCHTVTFKDGEAGAEAEADDPENRSDTDISDKLNLEQIDTKVMKQAFQEADAEFTMPPFPELQDIDLSHNQIANEEGLLPVAAWPALSTIRIHDNPLTMYTSGYPPLLRQFLNKRLGIQVIRKRPEPLPKPTLGIQLNQDRTVNTIISSVPRCNVEELLALEGSLSYRTYRQVAAPTPRSMQSSDQTPRDPAETDRSSRLPPIPPRAKSGTRSNLEGEAFFMTQLEDQHGSPEPESSINSQAPQRAKAATARYAREKKPNKKPQLPAQYRHYEELLHLSSDDEDPDNLVEQDLGGNIKSLQYILRHPLQFRTQGVPLDQPQPPFRPLLKHPQPVRKSRKTKEAEMIEILTMLRERSTMVESGLNDALKNVDKDKRNYRDARRLLTEVQKRYDAVRAATIRHPGPTDLSPEQLLEEALSAANQPVPPSPSTGQPV